MVGKKISDLQDGTAVNTDTLFEVSEPVKQTQSDGSVVVTGYKTFRASISYIIALLKNTAMSFPWLSVKGIDSFSELDAANGMQVKFNEADTSLADGNPAKVANVTVSGYGNSVYKMPMYAADIGFIVSDDKGNFVSTVQAAKKDLSNVDMPTLVSKIDTQRGSAPVLTNGGDQSINGTFSAPKVGAILFEMTAKAATTSYGFSFSRDGLPRFGVLSNSDDSTLAFTSYGDDGNWIHSPFFIERSTGHVVIGDGIRPNSDGFTSLGFADKRWTSLYATNGTIQTSDERLKDNIVSISDDVLDVWESLRPWCQFTMVESSNSSPRLHLGAIAQRVIGAFSDAGLNAYDYGLACYDKWEEHSEQEFDKMVDVKDPETGSIIRQPSYKTVTIPAGDRYSLRYDECLVMEAALMRRTTERLAARVAELEK